MFRCLIALSLISLFSVALAEQTESIPVADGLQAAADSLVAPTFRGPGAVAVQVDLPSVPDDLTSEIPGVLKTGEVTTLAPPVTAADLKWERADGYSTARVRFAATKAGRLKVHVALPPGGPVIEFRVRGSAESMVSEPVSSTSASDGELWLPVTDGSGVELEIALAAPAKPEDVAVTIDRVALMVVPKRDSSTGGMAPLANGNAERNELDLACWFGNANYVALTNAAKATAMITFIKGGGAYQCTGTLLSDLGHTRTPWFTTAYHCFDSQAAASSADFEWNFRAKTCGEPELVVSHRKTTGGAKLLWNEFEREIAFVRLNNPPSIYALFSGWTTNIAVDERIWGVHHPNGDHTMVSRGNVTALRQTINDLDNGGTHVLDTVLYTDGGVESGSSGSGLFSVANGAAYWKGTLFGGNPNNYQDAGYSHFAGYYDQLKPWLAGCRLPWGGHLPNGQSVTAYAERSALDCDLVAETRTCEDGILSGSFSFKVCRQGCELPWGGAINHGQSVPAYPADNPPGCGKRVQMRACTNGVLRGSNASPACAGMCPDGWTPAAPMAFAGAEQTVNVGDRVRLDGSLSCNANPPGPEKGLRYLWQPRPNAVPKNSDDTPAAFVLAGKARAKPSFVPPLPGDYTFELSVYNTAAASPLSVTMVHVGGAITVDAPSQGATWNIAQALTVNWSSTGISPNKRYNLILVTRPSDPANRKTFRLKSGYKPADPTAASFTVSIGNPARAQQMLAPEAQIQVCLPPIGRNDAVCGTSGVFGIQ